MAAVRAVARPARPRTNEETLAGLIETLGPDATLRVLEAYGGQRLRLPVGLRSGSPLLTLLGRRIAETLVAARGGETIAVPLAREFRARMYFSRGWSTRKIAVTLVMKWETVRAMTRGLEAPPRRPTGGCRGVVPNPLQTALDL